MHILYFHDRYETTIIGISENKNALKDLRDNCISIACSIAPDSNQTKEMYYYFDEKDPI
jgi:hypothetical protein